MYPTGFSGLPLLEGSISVEYFLCELSCVFFFQPKLH